MDKKIKELREELIFNVLRLVEKENLAFTELCSVGYDPEILSFIFRVREYILECQKNREAQNGRN